MRASLSPPRSAYDRDVERTLLQRIHNPHNHECACDPDCWCNHTAVGRAVKWWFPARYFHFVGLHHKSTRLEEWKRGRPPGALREWKRGRDQTHKLVPLGFEAQPKYEKIVRLGPMRYGMTVTLDNGETVIHELLGSPRPYGRPR